MLVSPSRASSDLMLFLTYRTRAPPFRYRNAYSIHPTAIVIPPKKHGMIATLDSLLLTWKHVCRCRQMSQAVGRPFFFFPARGPAPQASRFPVIRRILLPRVSIPARLLVFLVFSYRHIFQGTYCQLAEHTSLLFSLGFSRACVLLFSRSGLCDDVEILMIYEFVNCQDFDNWSFYLEELR
ncbi:hypothetical protein M440DRAFT_78589 [Trichoderma longibrachiatum ATCC 18648]|uniref:Uncharacterized protein n=1 Tax=Trichoderma longibrachiatum ATCC 18648 TaxID=983965 RepID=A0A2T4CI32_TRILO|nr:hypothetical protein M440DRAFT_78589 [Trichoderma longibrachiatum ATCC 18648]